MLWTLTWSNSPRNSPLKNENSAPRKDFVSIAARVDTWHLLALPSPTPPRNLMSNVPEKKRDSPNSRKLKKMKKMKK